MHYLPHLFLKADNAAARSEAYLWCWIQNSYYLQNLGLPSLQYYSHMSSFFSITNCFTSLRNLQYSVRNLLSPLCRNLLYTSRLCLILPLISSSHHLVDLPVSIYPSCAVCACALRSPLMLKHSPK